MVCGAIQGFRVSTVAPAPLPSASLRDTPRRASILRASAEPQAKAEKREEKKVEESSGTKAYVRPLKNKEKADIYLGYGKNDKREGKGRIIKDDPKKYPGKEDAGFFTGVVGGWAGGEVGLWDLRDEVKNSEATGDKEKGAGLDISGITNFLAPKDNEEDFITTTVNGKKVKAPVRKKNSDLVYLGNKNKAEPGVPGSFIMDDARKYPDKEDVGVFAGVTGGFAGGEQGVKQFAEKGDVDLAPPGSKSKQFDPLIVIGAVFGAAIAGGGYMLTNNTGVADGSSVAGGLAAVAGGSAVDETKLTLIKVGAATVSTLGLILGVRSAAKGAVKKLASGSKTFAVNAAFFAAVALAVKAILEN